METEQIDARWFGVISGPTPHEYLEAPKSTNNDSTQALLRLSTYLSQNQPAHARFPKGFYYFSKSIAWPGDHLEFEGAGEGETVFVSVAPIGTYAPAVRDEVHGESENAIAFRWIGTERELSKALNPKQKLNIHSFSKIMAPWQPIDDNAFNKIEKARGPRSYFINSIALIRVSNVHLHNVFIDGSAFTEINALALAVDKGLIENVVVRNCLKGGNHIGTLHPSPSSQGVPSRKVVVRNCQVSRCWDDAFAAVSAGTRYRKLDTDRTRGVVFDACKAFEIFRVGSGFKLAGVLRSAVSDSSASGCAEAGIVAITDSYAPFCPERLSIQARTTQNKKPIVAVGH